MEKKTGNVVVYQAKNGAIEFRGDLSRETIWATQARIAELFGIERSVATKHLRNILKDKELDAKSVRANFAHTASDGKTYHVEHYNLDAILSIGYRTNSKICYWIPKMGDENTARTHYERFHDQPITDLRKLRLVYQNRGRHSGYPAGSCHAEHPNA